MFLIDVLAGACQNCGIRSDWTFVSLFHTSEEMTAICERLLALLHYEALHYYSKIKEWSI